MTYKRKRNDTMPAHLSLGYICRHPEILFGNCASQNYLDLGYRVSNMMPQNHEQHDNLTTRVLEAYRILDELYAPW